MTANDGPKLEPNGDHTDMRVNGPLRLDLRDFTSPPGIMFALPSVTPGTGNLVVENTRYGSLCRFEVSGRADVKGHTIGVHIGFAERLTVCTAEIRALTYKATLSVPAGSYDVAVIHENGNEADTLVKRAVTVR
jgi:hypothetical protein